MALAQPKQVERLNARSINHHDRLQKMFILRDECQRMQDLRLAGDVGQVLLGLTNG